MDKGDIGGLVGAVVAGAVTASTGVGLPWVIAATAGGGYAGHHIAEPHHYKPIYQH